MRRVVYIFAVIACVSHGIALAREPIAFAFGENESWMVVYKENGRTVARYGNMAPQVVKALEEIDKEGKTLYGAALDGDNGFVLCSSKQGSHSLIAKNIYQAPVSKVKQLRDEGYQIKDLALTPDKGYAILYRHSRSTTNGWTCQNIPAGLSDAFDYIRDEGASPEAVGIAPNGNWIIVYLYPGGNRWHLKHGGKFPHDFHVFMHDNF